MAFLVAPGAGHAAAAAVRALDIEAHLLEQLPKRLEARRRLLVTVAVHERAALELRRLVAVAAQELGEVERLLAQALHVLVLRHELRCFVLQYRDAARLDADDRRAGADLLAKRTEHTFEVAPREVEHPVVVERPPATELRARDRHVVAGRLQRLHRGNADLRMEVVVEGVGPEDELLARRRAFRPRAEPVAQRARRELRELARGMRAREELREPRAHEGVRERGLLRGDARGLVDQSERVCRARSQAPPVVMREELRLERRHVDAHGAVVCAALAGEAQVERVVHLPGAPHVEVAAVQHLPEDSCAAASRVLLLERDLVARAHDVAARIGAPALPDADAARRRVREAAVVVREGEVRLDVRRPVVGAETEV